MKTPIVIAISITLVVRPLAAQSAPASRDQARAQAAETGYVSAMKRDLRQLATAEEA